MRYLITSFDGKTIASTLSANDETHFQSVNCGSLLSANGRFRLGKISNALGSIWAISEDVDFVKSSQKFKNTAKCILESIKYINEIAAEQREINNRNTSRLIHNLTTLNAHNIRRFTHLSLKKRSPEELKIILITYEQKSRAIRLRHQRFY